MKRRGGASAGSASSLARARTASVIGSVSLPVKVFCWLGWKQPSRVQRPRSASAPWPKRGFGRGVGTPIAARRAQEAVPAEGAEGDDHAGAVEQVELALQIREAVVALRRRRLVGGRRAADGGGDVGVDQPQAVVAAHRGRLVGEAGPVKRRVEPVAGAVAGEHAAGAVGAVGGGGEADDQDPRRGVAEAADRPRPVVLAAETARRVGRLRLAPGDQPRAAPAGVDLGGERLELHARGPTHKVGHRSMA